jgi:hypothetical protein
MSYFNEFNDEGDQELEVWKGALWYGAALTVSVIAALYHQEMLPSWMRLLFSGAAIGCGVALLVFMVVGEGLPYPLFYRTENRSIPRWLQWLSGLILCIWMTGLFTMGILALPVY